MLNVRSLFTFLIPLSASAGFAWLIVCRVLLGASEGVGFPAVHSLLGKWIPVSERSQSVAIVTAFSYLGSVLSSVIASALLNPFGWETIFYSFGIFGSFWCIPWFYFGSNEPIIGFRGLSGREFEIIVNPKSKHFYSTHLHAESNDMFGSPLLNEDIDTSSGSMLVSLDGDILPDETDSSVSKDVQIPWKIILSSKEVWAIIINQFCQAWGFYTILSYLPQYFETVYHKDRDDAGYLTVLPNLIQGLAGIAVGFFGDYLTSKRAIRVSVVRTGAQMVGMLGPALFFALLGYTQNLNVWVADVLVTLALGTNVATLIGVSCSQLDIAPAYAGTIFALGNFASTLAGMSGTLVTGFILGNKQSDEQSWSTIFLVCSFMNVIGAISWWFMGGGDKIIIY